MIISHFFRFSHDRIYPKGNARLSTLPGFILRLIHTSNTHSGFRRLMMILR